MALPLSRNTTYAVLSDVESADLNDIQDKIVDQFFQVPRRYPAATGYQTTGSSGAVQATGSVNFTNPADVWTIPIPVKPGSRLEAVRLRVTDQASFGGGSVTLTVKRSVDGAAGVTIGTPATSDQSGTPQTLAVTGLAEDVGALGALSNTYVAEVSFSGGTPMDVHQMEVEFANIP